MWFFLPCEPCQHLPALPICVSWLLRGGFCPPTGPEPLPSPSSIAVTFAEYWSDCGLFLRPAAVTGQVTLEQNPRAVTVQEGDAVTFECSMKGGSVSSYYMYWNRQGGRGMEWISRDGYSYGEVFQGHFKATEDSSENRFPLQILAAQQGDAAMYYCGARITLDSCQKWAPT
uniref:Ig-like domain-containing protein n=1 Tax=Serinus canaria TaxID=9135 RepID=A0A8C9NGY0_SERCA